MLTASPAQMVRVGTIEEGIGVATNPEMGVSKTILTQCVATERIENGQDISTPERRPTEVGSSEGHQI